MRCNPTKQHFEVSHGPVARRAVAAYVCGDASSRWYRGPAHAADSPIAGRTTTVAKLLDHDIVLCRLQRLVDFRAWRPLEIAPLIIDIMGLRFDIGKDADVGQIFAFGRMAGKPRGFFDHDNIAAVLRSSEQYLPSSADDERRADAPRYFA